MCTTCGCADGNLYIEGDERNPHSLFRSAPFAPAGRPALSITGVRTREFEPQAADNGYLHYGKTTLLTETLMRLKDRVSCAVIEGDQQTVNDAARIRATGTPAIQVNTGKGCHLDAQMIADAAPRLPLESNGILFIENVGNLVCPASFDLGERHKVAVLSVTEGEAKPLKYPHMFAAASVMLLNKVDLLPYLNFDVEKCLACAREVNPNIEIILLSATSGEGMDTWLNWLETQRCA